MGQIYSFLGYSTASESSNKAETLLAANFSCKICSKLLEDPVQCERNEADFCRKCITEHLCESEICPTCLEQMTIAALSRIEANGVSELRKPSSSVVGKGCTENAPIYIFGGESTGGKPVKSVEVFNWSTKTWTLIENCLFFHRRCSFSFLYGKKMMVCGGCDTGRIEYLNPDVNGHYPTASSVSLTHRSQFNGVLYKNKILSFYNGVVETSLESPGQSKMLVQQNYYRNCLAGVHCFGESIYIVGGQQSRMEKYDVAKNELQTLPDVPYSATDMATAAYKDNIIILGGCGETGLPLNNVVMFNATTQEYKKLPSMLEKRRSCTAVVVGDMIVVMGGEFREDEKASKWTVLNTMEYHVIGESAWHELPAMNVARHSATACVYE